MKNIGLALIALSLLHACSKLPLLDNDCRSPVPGSFTVDASGKKVIFASGNLQAHIIGSGDELSVNWGFASWQGEFLGSTSCNVKPVAGGTADLFGWAAAGSPSAEKFGIGYNSDPSHYGSSVSDVLQDWGPLIGSGWRTLSDNEWKFLLNKRAGPRIGGVENARHSRAIVDGVRGLILFPDVIGWPSDIPLPRGINQCGSYNYADTSYGAGQWQILENLGCVFLPAAGHNPAKGNPEYGKTGAYISSSSKDNWRYCRRMIFKEDGVYTSVVSLRSALCAVRLVQDI